ncbi:MAG TPA: cytochrome P450 [Candidatus Acidoferrales bacterium]|jgi:cytochrome P450|nr:cytochrome P450 [Candidatus Acidoferrales bacterium]
MPSNPNRVLPGPKGLPVLGVAFEVRSDPLGMMRRYAREYGDIVRFHVMGQERILLNHPDFIEQVLVVQQSKFHKSELTRRITGRMLGQGLLISEGDFWRRQRRLAQPAFHRARVNEYSTTMAEIAESHIAQWRDGEERNVSQDMMGLTLDIAVRTLFGTTLPGEAEQVGHAMTFLMRYSLRRQRMPLRIPETWPTPNNRRARQELAFMDSLVYRIISERQASNGGSAHHHDLLALLMDAMDEDGSHMTTQQLRDETMTLFIAGHETTSQMLSWTWYALSQNPAMEERLYDELYEVLAGRAPGVADLQRLPYLQAVMNESLRLYPPAYILARMAIEPCQIGGYDIPLGSTILLAPWVTHRDPRFFDDAETYRPERWLDGLAQRLPAGAYFPFGDGPRRCIGQGFALMEAAIVIAMVAQKFRFRLVPGHEVVPEPLVTLRPRHGIRMTLHMRAAERRARAE